MTRKEAEKIIRDYVKQYGRALLREKLHALAKDYPGNQTLVLNAGHEFLRLPDADK